jgi:hypothetical protein
MICTTSVSLNHPIGSPTKPSNAEQLVPFLVKHEEGAEEVCIIVSPKREHLTETIVMFIELHEGSSPSWCNAQYLDDSYEFIRYLNADEFVKIHGVKGKL